MENNVKEGKYSSPDEVVKSLQRKRDVKIDNTLKRIEVLKKDKGNPTDLGNGSFGKLDYLTNYCGYTLSNVSKFTITGYKNY